MLQHVQQRARAAVVPRHRHRAIGRRPLPLPSLHAVRRDEVQYWDVVEYVCDGNARLLRLGLIQQCDVDAAVTVVPLVEEADGVWVPEESAAEEAVPLERVLRVVEHVYGQRQDVLHNPHGEHAHDVWQVLVPLSPAVLRQTL